MARPLPSAEAPLTAAKVVNPSMRRIDAVQLLRALAATMVVLGHLVGAARLHQYELGAFPRLSFFGGAGVDLFFAISGFIIVHTGVRLLDAGKPSRTFLLRRLARILPLYWGATLLPIIAAILLGRETPSLQSIVLSLAFIPYDRSGTGEFYPLCDLGWTLNYEIQFYALFAFWMYIAKQRCAEFTAFSLLLLVAYGLLLGPQNGPLVFWTQPIILEFGAGMILALLFRANRLQLSSLTRAVLIALAITVYVTDPLGLVRMNMTPNGFQRVLGWGVPGVMLLSAALASSWQPRSRLSKAGVLLGNASFSLYLLHPFAITAARHGLTHMPLPHGWGGWLLVVGGFVIAAICSIGAYLWIETPLTRWLTGILTSSGRARPNARVSSIAKANAEYT